MLHSKGNELKIFIFAGIRVNTRSEVAGFVQTTPVARAEAKQWHIGI